MTHGGLEEKSIAAIAMNRAQMFKGRVYLKAKWRAGKKVDEWVDYIWDDLVDEQLKLHAAYKSLGVTPEDRMALMGGNRPRWVTSGVSYIVSRIPLVTVYPTLTSEEAGYVLSNSESRFVMVDTMDNAKKILERFDDLPKLEKVFVMDPIDPGGDDRIITYDQLLSMGEDHVDLKEIEDNVKLAQTDDTIAMIYTSGTTGQPKGVELTNGNMISQRVVLPIFNLNSEDTFLNHLPFCHSFGMTADFLGTADVGAVLAIADGMKPEQIRHGLTTIRPTVLMSVPRLYEKLYIEVQRVVSSRGSKVRKLFDGALAIGKEVFDLKNEGKSVPLGLGVKFKLAKKILGKVRNDAGLDRVRIAYGGGGPTSRELCYFFQSLGIDIYQGYGLTETSPICNVNLPGKNKMGMVGPPIEGVEEKLADDGEILVRGPNVMKGYFGNPEATKETMTEDGWFLTGDIGEIDEDGYLKITDRKKELIITSGGKNIAPLSIESAFNTERYIEMLVVIGDNRKYLTALICPNFVLLKEWAGKKGLWWNSTKKLIELPEVTKLYEERIASVNKTFARFEQIKKFTLIDHEFSQETGELTPTQKVKRRIVNTAYETEISAMYPKEDVI